MATVVICMAPGSYTHFSPINALWHFHVDTPHATPTPANVATAKAPAASALPAPATAAANTLKLQVLGAQDAALYNAIFDAQSKSDWDSADKSIAQLSDKTLMGDVLADRYQRRTATLAELQNWLAAYADLPQAPALYAKARKIPGARTVKLTQPDVSDRWAGSDHYYSAPGLGSADHFPTTPAARRLAAKVELALRKNEIYVPKALIETEQKHRVIPPAELATLENRVAAAFLHDGKLVEARAWAASATKASPNALWTYGLTSWKQGDSGVAAESFAALAQRNDLSASNRAAASFWAYRAYHKDGNREKADYWLKQAALQPHSFYGFLAAGLLGSTDHGSWQVPALDKDSIALLSAQPDGRRALALLQIDRKDQALQELRNLNPSSLTGESRRDLQAAMLAVADAAHMPTLALQLGGLAVNDNGRPYDAAFYPVPPWQPSDGFQIDRALLYALMRHESQFNPAAVSTQGACGLMQLMPATARLMTDEKLDSRCSGRLKEPVFNLGLGQDYVQRLSQDPMIGDNLVTLLAAYNGGPARLPQWLGDSRKDPLLFIESLPVAETRGYVQQVLIHYWMYRARLGQPLTSLTQLAKGDWPHYALHDEAPHLPEVREAENDGIKVASARR